MSRGQEGVPESNVISTSVSFDSCLRHRCIMRRGTKNTWGICGFTRWSSLKSSNTVSMAAGGGAHKRGSLKVWSKNQSSGSNFLSSAPNHGFPPESLHHPLTHSSKPPPARSRAPWLRGRKRIGSEPDFIIPSMRSPRDNPSTPAAFILVPAT